MASGVTRLVLVVAPELLLVALQFLDEALRRDDAGAPLLRADLRKAWQGPAQFWYRPDAIPDSDSAQSH